MKVAAVILEFCGHLAKEFRQGAVGNIYRLSLNVR